MSQLAEESTTEEVVDIDGAQVRCVVVRIPRKSAVSHVYLATEWGYMPVRNAVVGPDKIAIYQMSVKKAAASEAQSQEIWLPLEISVNQINVKQSSKTDFDTSYRHTYSVDPASVMVNKPMESSVFTLTYDGMLNVYLNDNEVYLPEQDTTIKLGALPVPMRIENNRPATLKKLLFWNVLVLSFILLVLLVKRIVARRFT